MILSIQKTVATPEGRLQFLINQTKLNQKYFPRKAGYKQIHKQKEGNKLGKD